MGETRADSPLFFLDAKMSEPELRAIAGGTAAVFSARRPDGEGAGQENEDAAALIHYGNNAGVLAVADGFGGQPSGAQASKLALKALAAAVRAAAEKNGELREAILDGFEQANAAVRALGVCAATTLAVAEIQSGALRPYHVGDSQVLCMGLRGKLKLETVSHSPTGYALASGLLDEKEALQHKERHLVLNMIGSEQMHIAIGPSVKLAERDTVLLASDGLFDNLRTPEVAKIVRCGPLPSAAAALFAACRRRMEAPQDGEPSKPDDLTFVAFRLGAKRR
ncbi:MAG: protein phosphatase 2C domain-containing protein [Planctomycetes bacterium]|nr:protein phosphatase 2C domain-containing protein [Planctomycetota bacterium]